MVRAGMFHFYFLSNSFTLHWEALLLCPANYAEPRFPLNFKHFLDHYFIELIIKFTL